MYSLACEMQDTWEPSRQPKTWSAPVSRLPWFLKWTKRRGEANCSGVVGEILTRLSVTTFFENLWSWWISQSCCVFALNSENSYQVKAYKPFHVFLLKPSFFVQVRSLFWFISFIFTFSDGFWLVPVEHFAGQLMVWGDCVMKLGQDLNFGPSRRSDKSWGKVGIFKRNALKMWGWVNSDHFPHEKFILVREFPWRVSRLAEKEAGATRGDGWSSLNLKVIWPVWGSIARLGSSSIFFSALLVPC